MQSSQKSMGSHVFRVLIDPNVLTPSVRSPHPSPLGPGFDPNALPKPVIQLPPEGSGPTVKWLAFCPPAWRR